MCMRVCVRLRILEPWKMLQVSRVCEYMCVPVRVWVHMFVF